MAPYITTRGRSGLHTAWLMVVIEKLQEEMKEHIDDA